jgi:chromosome segregation ATPase
MAPGEGCGNIDDGDNTITKLKADLRVARQRTDRLEAENKALKAKINAIEEAMEALHVSYTEDIATRERDLQRSEDRTYRLETQVADQHELVQRLQRENTELKENLRTNDAKVDLLRDVKKSQRTHLQDIQGEMDTIISLEDSLPKQKTKASTNRRNELHMRIERIVNRLASIFPN